MNINMKILPDEGRKREGRRVTKGKGRGAKRKKVNLEVNLFSDED
jgi:hypothetical protein